MDPCFLLFSRLDFANERPEKQWPVSLLISNHYSQWRAACLGPPELREPSRNAPPERLVQAIWHHQRIRRDQLKTADGRPVWVLHPGFWNREAGPDFLCAVVRIGDAAPISGDVEIDLQVSDWRGHGHHANAAFAKVVLHVVWTAPTQVPAGLPTLALETYLDSPWSELAVWLGAEAAGEWPEILSGRCCAPLRDLAEADLNALLRQSAEVRLRRKAHELQARARQAGWEQALWEGLFRALGYKNNIWPFHRLAELRPILIKGRSGSPMQWQAWLFGLAGLLPAALNDGGSKAREYLRELWDVWWRDRNTFEEIQLPRAIWKFHGLRPANHPERRLALAAHWLAAGELGGGLEDWFKAQYSPAKRLQALVKVLAISKDPFWDSHWTLRSARMQKTQPLLGANRVTDLAINVILPWLLARADAGGHQAAIEKVEELYFNWPEAEDNAVLRLARRRLLASGRSRLCRTAAAQQGLMQIVRDFCDHSNSICDQCAFPDLVRSLSAGKSNPAPTSK